MQNIDSYLGKDCLIEYKDAAYSSINIISNNVNMPRSIISFGKIRRIADNFIDLSFVWSDDKSYYNGVLIPRGTILNITPV